MLKSPTIIVWESKSLCSSLKTCFIYLGAPVLGAYIFRIISSYCCIDPFTTMKSILSDARIATPAFYLFIFPLHLVGKSFSIPLFWVFVYLWMWNGSGYSIPLGFGCIFWLGDLDDLNLGFLPFDVNWLFYPFIDINYLCWCSLLFGIFLERLILVVPFYV